MMTEPRYLGDGVYARFDGYQIWLQTERGGMMHTIAIEPPVLTALQAYAAACFVPPAPPVDPKPEGEGA